MVNIAINGFGRIGRCAFRIGFDKVNIVAINNPGEPKDFAYLLKYDSVHGKWNRKIEAEENAIIIDGKRIPFFGKRDPKELPWKDLNIDVVIECTGVFRDREGAAQHLTAGAKKVVISAPGKNIDKTIVLGVNDDEYDKENHHVLSNASCTTNSLAPVVKVLNDSIGIERGTITTVHSYTSDQILLDGKHKKDPRRGRSAALSIVPTSTGAAKAVTEVIPSLKGKLDGLAMRVPTPNVSITDFVFTAKRDTSTEEVNQILKEASEGRLKGILGFSEEPLVSVDYRNDTHSGIIDGKKTMVVDNKMVKVLSWYDNEWGYSNRLIDLVQKI